MPTPKMTAAQITELRQHADDYIEAHKDGGYAERSWQLRDGHLNAFFMFLEGRYDPSSEKGQRRV